MRLGVAKNRAGCSLTVSVAEFDVLMQAIEEKRPPVLPAEVLEHLKEHGHYSTQEWDGRWSTLLGLNVYVEGRDEQ